MTAEQQRLDEARTKDVPWRKWGPYLSERQWGTVREDYSDSGDAWNSFPHDQARSRAYRWGEDGLAGISDDQQRLCFALALWNGKDPILKERMFGLTNSEGNHGEDVKEYYFYLDSTPTHSYMKYLYKYPQAAYPYDQIVTTNRNRSRTELEYELLDTGVFDQDRYFDVFVEYAKASPEDILVQVTVHNRGPEPATLHLLPTLWFRNVWAMRPDIRPGLRQLAPGDTGGVVAASDPSLGERFLHAEGQSTLLFTENDTNSARLIGIPNRTPYLKDGINDYVVHGRRSAVNPANTGTKAAVHYTCTVAAGASHIVRLRLNQVAPAPAKKGAGAPFGDFETVMKARRREADEFYAERIPKILDADETSVIRQAIAGMLWSKQFYNYDVNKWLEEHGADPFNPRRHAPRNEHWHHMHNADVVSMPDKWEYPWYAAWDLAFHVLALALVDADFAKQQLDLMLREDYLHPNGQLPAYEWNFSDVNPPVHAFSTMFTYGLLQNQGVADVEWLERAFQKLLLNFTWWVNRKDRTGNNLFEGGFLGLDNIGVFDRSSPLPTGGYLAQADGTAWMALFSQNMLEIATTLTLARPSYVPMVIKFIEHFLWIASSMIHAGGGVGMWDEEDGFFYDVLRLPDGRAERLKVRSMVGLLPLCAATIFEGTLAERHPELKVHFDRFLGARPELVASIHDPRLRGQKGRRLAAILNETRLRRVLSVMLDEQEFLSPHGIRSISRRHAEHPFVFHVGGQEYRVGYLPAESDTGMFGGNSNWRGPIWMPVNALIVRSLLQYYSYYGDDFTIECPTGSGNKMTLYDVAEDIVNRLASIFLRDAQGRRPVYGATRKFQEDPHWRDLILFYEYFHGDNGAGLGASHQTGWTGTIATLMGVFATTTPEQVLELGKKAAITRTDASARRKRAARRA